MKCKLVEVKVTHSSRCMYFGYIWSSKSLWTVADECHQQGLLWSPSEEDIDYEYCYNFLLAFELHETSNISALSHYLQVAVLQIAY
jgi:hypothetical protein